MAKIRIELTPTSMGSRVFIDDVEINSLVAVDVRAAVDEASTITLTFRATEVEISGEAGQVKTKERP